MATVDALPVPCKDVVVRREPDGVLLFQVETDEMYFVPDGAFALFQLCDGTSTVGQIARLVASYRPEFASAEGEASVARFMDALADRHLIELWR